MGRVALLALAAASAILCAGCPRARAIPPEICPGQAVHLTAENASGPCEWSPAADVADPFACDTYASPAKTTAYFVTFLNIYYQGVVTVGTGPVVVQSVVQTPPISAPSSASPGEAGLTASVPLSEGPYLTSSYNWTIVNGEITSGQGNHAITFSAARQPTRTGPVGHVVLSVVETPPGGCPGLPSTRAIPLGPARSVRVVPAR